MKSEIDLRAASGTVEYRRKKKGTQFKTLLPGEKASLDQRRSKGWIVHLTNQAKCELHRQNPTKSLCLAVEAKGGKLIKVRSYARPVQRKAGRETEAPWKGGMRVVTMTSGPQGLTGLTYRSKNVRIAILAK